jgi:uncharacterized Ntn-hydrolase superfamily protein
MKSSTCLYKYILAYCLNIFALFFLPSHARSQDTFSIVAVDTLTGEVGSAGASCVDLILFFPNYSIDFLGDLLPGQGAINTQASYSTVNQANARARMLAGDNPQEIINWLVANDANNTPNSRQYGIASLSNGSALTAGFTGTGTLNYKNHIAGPNYCIQGNILLGQAILDSMEARFIREPGDLACKLMAALQGAKVPGADTRCSSNGSNGTSSLFAFLKVAQPTDTYGNPSLIVSVKTPGGFGIEPIDSLQILFDNAHSCSSAVGLEASLEGLHVYPNPVEHTLMLAYEPAHPDFTNCTYSFRNTIGQNVLHGFLPRTENSIDVSALPAGIYFLEWITPQSRLVKKIVKQ